uniref:Uncharacterized protein n=1 Tax=Romanomermis culicivorax TaxID=13658 RepID=A0A915KBX4_ROMCU
MKLLLYLLINTIELTAVQVLASFSDGLLFTYGDDVSWDKPPKHLVRVRDGVETVVSDEPRVEIFFIKHKSIPGSLDATPKQWRFVEKAARATVKILKDVRT